MSRKLYPLLFGPVYKDYIWGGDRIPRLFNREPQNGVCAESWEISDRGEGMSVVTNGALAGTSLAELVKNSAEDLLGRSYAGTTVFPLLIKIIDAKEQLSVQVHPDDDSARRAGGEAKTEMWYVLDAEPHAAIYAGLKPGTSPETFKAALKSEHLEKVLNTIKPRRGTAVYVPGGRVHAIGSGLLLLEVQQNSNTTYRVYDWGRVGKDGKPRELHVDKAMSVINWRDSEPITVEPRGMEAENGVQRREILKCPYFRVTRSTTGKATEIRNSCQSFSILFQLEGNLEIRNGGNAENIGPGTSCLIPASVESCSLVPSGSTASFLNITPAVQPSFSGTNAA
ncbi:MAG: type I phosphomannose isomerase catalytic subunit [Kiritimatiellia bacterium]